LGQQGTVMLAVEVTADGRAGSVRLAQSSGFALLDAAALQAVRRWTFEPARNLGLAVASHVEVPVRFDLRPR
jgi:protein TonB